jgi:hypothetical protein
MFDFPKTQRRNLARADLEGQHFESETNVSGARRRARERSAFSVRTVTCFAAMEAHFVKRAGIVPELENQLRENDPQIPQMKKTHSLTGLADRHGR